MNNDQRTNISNENYQKKRTLNNNDLDQFFISLNNKKISDSLNSLNLSQSSNFSYEPLYKKQTLNSIHNIPSFNNNINQNSFIQIPPLSTNLQNLEKKHDYSSLNIFSSSLKNNLINSNNSELFFSNKPSFSLETTTSNTNNLYPLLIFPSSSPSDLSNFATSQKYQNQVNNTLLLLFIKFKYKKTKTLPSLNSVISESPPKLYNISNTNNFQK